MNVVQVRIPSGGMVGSLVSGMVRIEIEMRVSGMVGIESEMRMEGIVGMRVK